MDRDSGYDLALVGFLTRKAVGLDSKSWECYVDVLISVISSWAHGLLPRINDPEKLKISCYG
jgi:hypothetical protein